MFEMASLQEDALREYDELEQIYLEIGNITDFAKTQCMAEKCCILLTISDVPFHCYAHSININRHLSLWEFVVVRKGILSSEVLKFFLFTPVFLTSLCVKKSSSVGQALNQCSTGN